MVQIVVITCKVQVVAVGADIQGDSVARGPKLLSIKNYVVEIMT